MHFLIKLDKATKSFQGKPTRNHVYNTTLSIKRAAAARNVLKFECATCSGFKRLKMEKSFVVLTVLIGICCVIYQTESAPITTTSPGVCMYVCMCVCLCVCVCVCVCVRVCV